MTSRPQGGWKRRWLYPLSEEPPEEFREHGPIEGNKTELGRYAVQAINRKTDHRYIEMFALAGVIWVRGYGHTLEVYFKNPRHYERAKQFSEQHKSAAITNNQHD